MHQVGAGVLGPVFRGYDPELDRAVAIKAFALDLTPEQARDLAADLGRLPAASLTHPSILAPIASGADGSTAYLVQEYFVAESADVALKQYGPAPVPDAMRLIGQLAGALDFAAAAGVHHGALHPRDILVAPHEVRLSGLGIVEALERVGFRAPVRRPYAAPERASGAPFGGAADVFSLAGVSYELITGRRPSLSGEHVKVETDAIQAADGAALAEVFARALSARPDDRYGSALAFAANLKHALTGEPLVMGESTERPRVRRVPRAARKEPAAAVPRAAERPERGHETVESKVPREPSVGITPLPSFLESYRPPMAEPLEAVPTEPLAEEPLGSAPLAPPSPPAEEPTLAGSCVAAPEMPTAPDLDLAELDRRTEATATPFPPGALDDFDPRVGATMEVPVVRRVSSEPTPAEEPVQPTLRLDDPGEAPDAAGDPAAPGDSPPAEPAVEHRASRVGLASLLGMLLIGFLLGIPAGYLMAPKASPEPVLSGAKPATPAPPEGAAGQPAAAPASAVPAPQPPTSGTPTPTPPVKAAATPVPAAAVAATPVKKAASPTAARQPAKSDAARGAPAAATAGQPATARKTAPATRATFQGGLVIVSRPDGATVSIDGRPVGTTPLTMQALTAGSHAVRLELAGYNVWTSGVQVTAGKVNRVTASLERRPGG